MVLNEFPQRLGMPTVPSSMFFGDGRGIITGVKVQNAVDEITVDQRIAGVQCGSLPIRGNRLIELALVFQGIPQIIVGFGRIEVHGDGPAKSRDGLIEPTYFFQRHSKIIVGFGIFGLEVQSPAGRRRSTSSNCPLSPRANPRLW